MDAGQVRVLIVADDPLARSGLAALLSAWPECTVVSQTASDVDLAEALDLYHPDVVVWDLGWDPGPEPVSLGAAEELGELDEAFIPMIALLPEPSYAADVWVAGARGLLDRDVDPGKLVSALLAVVQGLVVLDPEMAVAALPPREGVPGLLAEALTPREFEVLQLLAEGLTNKAIAHRLEISEHTVKFHVNALLGKLGVQSRTEAVVHATRLGLIIL